MNGFVRAIASTLVVSAMIGGPLGCGGGSSSGDVSPADLANLPPAPSELGILVVVKAGSGEAEAFTANVQSALTTSMTNAGYKLVSSPEGNPDVIANVTLNATEETSFFQVQVNGQVQKSYKVTISASFVAAGDAAVIDQTASDFSGKGGEVEQNAIDKVLVHLGKTRKLSNYATTAKAKAVKAEDDMWTAANVEGCRKPTVETACEGVEKYIAAYPSGKYTAEGRKALSEGEAAKVKLADDNAWKAAAVDICLKPTKSYDCKSVEEYIAKYPTGAYVAEGKSAMKKSESAREALAKQEALNKKKESRDECVKNCRRAYEQRYSFEVLSARCIQTECS